VAKVVAEDREGPDEGPAVGMQLGRGHVKLCKQLPFEAVEGESLTDAFEHPLVKEKEWLPVIGVVVNADRFANCARENGDIGSMYPPK